MEIIAYHGWGFDHTCWDPWKDRLPEGISLSAHDRGYYGDEVSPLFQDGDELQVIFAHSFGLHLVPPEQLSNANMVVIFSGFTRFHPVAAQFNRRSRMVLRKMINKFQKQPQKVVESFMQNTYHPDTTDLPDFGTMNRSKMVNDLKLLDESEFDPRFLNNAGKICILHGTEDAIVPHTKGRELYESLVEDASYFEVKQAGHALPFTHVDTCWSLVRPELQIITE